MYLVLLLIFFIFLKRFDCVLFCNVEFLCGIECLYKVVILILVIFKVIWCNGCNVSDIFKVFVDFDINIFIIFVVLFEDIGVKLNCWGVVLEMSSFECVKLKFDGFFVFFLVCCMFDVNGIMDVLFILWFFFVRMFLMFFRSWVK